MREKENYMITSMHTKGRLLISAFAVALLALVLTGCQPATKGEDTTGSAKPTNDSVVQGTLDAYDPSKEADTTSGKAIEGSEEEELQQERIAGGSVGAVTSKNLEPLTGITDGSEGEYVNSYGMNDQVPEMGHGDNGSDCLSCHKAEGAGAQQPKSHIDSKLANEDCTSCHVPKGK